MSTATAARPDVDASVLAALDFEYQCEVIAAATLVGVKLAERTCHEPAQWVAQFPCCGDRFFVCARHRHAPAGTVYYCPPCKQWWPHLVNWGRL